MKVDAAALVALFVFCSLYIVEGVSPPQVEALIILEPRPIQNVPGRSTLTLQCSASGDPIPVYSWTKDGVLLVEVDDKIVIKESILKIMNIDKDKDDGLYQCLATNTQGTVFKEIKINNAIMGKFQFPDRIGDPPTHVEVKIGRMAIIPCPKHGRTFPEIVQWGDLPNGKLPILWYPKRTRFFDQTGNLIFPEVTEDHVKEIADMQGVSCLLYNDKAYEQSRKIFLRSLGNISCFCATKKAQADWEQNDKMMIKVSPACLS